MSGTKTSEVDHYSDWLQQVTQVRRLLLVDDCVDDCSIIQRLTMRFNCEWSLASNAENAHYAVEMMGNIGGFSLIFLDLNLGGGKEDGVEVFRSLKRKLPDIPIVVLSGQLTERAISEITKIDFAFFAQKPTSFTNRYFDGLFKVMGIPHRPNYPQHKVIDAPTITPQI